MARLKKSSPITVTVKNLAAGKGLKMAVLKPIEKEPPASSETYIEILRGFIEAAYVSKMTFLEITAIVDGEIRTVKFYSRLE